ncbi:hypothetical protein [Longibacter sp.]|uniref:hypothetical protein n=1 Tax=Longibacter sp. TaxID=2045415 RepID=UPI003EBAA5DC
MMPPPSSDRSIHFHWSLDARPRERERLRRAIRESAADLSASLSPEWIIVRRAVAGQVLYLAHYRTTRRTVTAASAAELARRILEGALETDAGRTATDAEATGPSRR